MAKSKQPPWDRKPCGCVKTKLPRVGKVLIRCERHRDKPYKGKRVLCYWDDSGIVQRQACAVSALTHDLYGSGA